MRTRLLLVLLVCFLYGGSLLAQRRVVATSPAILMKVDAEFDRATAEKGIDAWISFFAEDGMQLTADGNIKGRKAIREYMAPAFARPGFALRWKASVADVSRSGDLGYTTGTYEIRGKTPQGQVVARTGRYVTIWKKQADGSWKVAVDVGNPDAPSRR